MTEQSLTRTPPISTASEVARPRLRLAGLVLLLGGVLFFAGVSRPVVTDWANAWDDPDAQLRFAQSAAGEFKLGFVLMGLGYALMGVGAGMLLLAMARLLTGRRARLAVIFGWVGIAGGTLVGGHRALLTMIDYEAMAVDRGWLAVAGTLGLGLGFIACGLLSWRGPIWRWPSVVFALSGLVGMITIPAVFMFAALAYGLLVIVQFRRSHPPRLSVPT